MITQAKGDCAAFVESVVSVLIELLEICADCSNGNWSYNNEVYGIHDGIGCGRRRGLRLCGKSGENMFLSYWFSVEVGDGGRDGGLCVGKVGDCGLCVVRRCGSRR